MLNFPWQFHCFVGAYTTMYCLTDLSLCYVTASATLKMELLVEKLVKLLVNLLIRESVNGSLFLFC